MHGQIRNMKAVILKAFGGVDNFAVADLPIPSIRPGEVRVRIKAVSFNPVDCQIRRGRPEGKQVRSMILGRDLSGIVDAVHEDLPDFQVGDEVFGHVCNLASSGTYAEYVSVPAELVAKKPDSMTHEQAAAMPVAATTASIALEKAKATGSKTLFIAGGAGGVGSFAISLAQQLGVLNLVTTAGNAKSRAYLVDHCKLDDDQIVDYRHPDFVEHAISCNGGSFDIALDFVGGKMLSACCALLALDGSLASATDAPSHDDFEIMFDKNASFHSVGTHSYSLASNRGTWRRYREMLDQLSRQYSSGPLRLPAIGVVGHLSAEVVATAHTLIDNNAVQGKLVMSC
jgi:NADPH:quinone reductase